MISGADRGRDIWLRQRERPSGLVQCKRVGSGFSAPDAIREVIKFLLFAEIEPSLLPEPSRFRYTLALSSDPASTTVELFDAPTKWLTGNGDKIEGYVAAVIAKYSTFKDLRRWRCNTRLQ